MPGIQDGNLTDLPNHIGIVDLGIGNIKSIERMVAKSGGASLIINSPSQLNKISKVILPGVGHYDAGMKKLKHLGLDTALSYLIEKKRIKLLGICLGMQLLCNHSEEGILPGLGLVNAKVVRFSSDQLSDIKVPHMGWNLVKPTKNNALIPKSFETNRFYFVHSFKVVPEDSAIIIGETDYAGNFCSAFQQDNIFGVQFHPEKSHRYGSALIQRFVEL
jgi:glutamine amidotransferase